MLEWYSLSGPADTLSKIRHLALCWGTAGHVQPVFLCVCVLGGGCCMCWGGLVETVINYTLATLLFSTCLYLKSGRARSHSLTKTHQCYPTHHYQSLSFTDMLPSRNTSKFVHKDNTPRPWLGKERTPMQIVSKCLTECFVCWRVKKINNRR